MTGMAPVVGAALVGLGLLMAGVVVVFPGRPRVRADLDRSRAARGGGGGLLAAMVALGDRWVDRRGDDRRKVLAEQAGLTIGPGEVLIREVGTTLAGAVLGALLLGVLGLVVGALLAFVGFRAFLKRKAAKRRAQFADQLNDALQLLAGSLRAGYGLLQAVDSVAREAESPTADEFQRLVMETRLGRPLAEALRGAAQRVGSEDFDWVVEAIEISRDVGAELAGVLDRVGETIRERDRLRRQIRTMSAEGRFSVKILLFLPVLMIVLQQVKDPGYLSMLTGTGTGQLLLVIGAALLALGAVWLRKIVAIRF